MKRIIKLVSILSLAIIMAISSLVCVAAEEKVSYDDDTVIITETDEDNPTREYELVWKYASAGGHLYKRRWNMTLGCWYDPDWILVY